MEQIKVKITKGVPIPPSKPGRKPGPVINLLQQLKPGDTHKPGLPLKLRPRVYEAAAKLNILVTTRINDDKKTFQVWRKPTS